MSKKELNIFKLLSEKPWEESQKAIDDKHDGKTLTLSKAKLGVRTIMVVSTVIFSLFIVSYSDRMLVHDWRSLSEPWLLWINTIILIFTSFVFHKAKILSDKNELEKAKKLFTFSWFFNFCFYYRSIISLATLCKSWTVCFNKSSKCILYLFTALHGLHVLGGLFFWGRATTKLFTKNYNVLKIKQAIELCAIYWHFLLIVWFILFGLMIAT